MKKFFVALVGVASLTFMNSCSKPFDDFDETTLSPEIGIPILDTELKMSDLVSSLDAYDYLTIGADGSYTFFYNKNLPYTNSFNLFDSVPTTPVPMIDSSLAIPFGPEGSKLEIIDLKSGSFKFSVGNTVEPLTVTVSIPEMVKNNQILTKTFNVGIGGRVTDSIDLNGYRVTPDANGKISLKYDARRSNGTRTTVLPLGNFYQISRLDARFIRGYFGKQELAAIDDSVTIDFFDNINFQGEVRFYEPRIILTVDNSFGTPFKVTMDRAEITPKTGNKFNMTGPLNNGVLLNYPSLTQIGAYSTTDIVYNNANSNVADVINAFPKKIAYKVRGELNPDTTNRVVGFATDSSALRLKMTAQLPALLSAKNFSSEENFDIDFSNFTNVKTAEMKVVADNGLPLEMTLQGYFMEGNTVVDSLFSSAKMILAGAPVGADGLPTAAAKSWTLIPLDAAKFDRLRRCTQLKVRYNFATTANGSMPVRLNNNQKVALRIGVKAGLSL